MEGPLLLADWGTSNRRAWLVGADGVVLASFADDRGLTAIAPGGWEAAYAGMVAGLGGARPRLALLAGMVGSNRGWSEAPYRPCPAGPAELAAVLHWVVPDEVAIVPGVCTLEPDADVMRGEEVQAIGAVAAGLVPADGLCCHPGTHSKWIRIEDGRIAGFRTVMTGELFALLKAHSLLSDLIQDEAKPGAAFFAGVDRGADRAGLTAELFRIRARVLLGAARREDATAYASGLLIGADLAAGLADMEAPRVHVVGRSDLALLFAAALEHRGREAVRVDGDAAALAGLRRIEEEMR
jgi:2-dehydro-3-deoxygalactonokinase